MKKYQLIFFCILLVGIFLRVYKLTSIPPSLSHDEVAITYNAFSILLTGNDEYGKRYPLLFQSFDDYKLPGMVYSTVPFVALFGKTEIAARLPSALYGIASIILLYFIVFEITRSQIPSLLSMFFLAIQPWHINFSRQLFESNGAVFWCMSGILYLLRSQKKYSYIIIAGIGFVISLYFYYSVRLVIPFILLIYICFFWKKIITNWQTTLIAVFLNLILFLPIATQMLSPGGLERISIVSVANDPNYLQRRDEYIQKMGTSPTIVQKIIFNRRVALVQTIIENYWKNVSPHNLFTTGTGTYGALYPFDRIVLLLGFVALFQSSRFSKYLILTWLFTAFLPGAFSINQPNTLRTLIAAPVFAILSGLGMYHIYNKKNILLIGIIILFFYPKFHYAYFVDNPHNNALAFGDGNKQMVLYAQAHEKDYDQIVISGYYWRPYIFMLFWGNTDPTSYQTNGSKEQFGKYIFTSAPWDSSGQKLMDPSFNFSVFPKETTLFVLSRQEYEVHKNKFMKIDTINGKIANEVFISAVLLPQ